MVGIERVKIEGNSYNETGKTEKDKIMGGRNKRIRNTISKEPSYLIQADMGLIFFYDYTKLDWIRLNDVQTQVHR